MFYGKIGEVSTCAGKITKEPMRGKPVRELDFGPMMSTSGDPRALIVLRWTRQASDQPQFHPYYFFEKLNIAFATAKLDAATLEECFLWSLETPWRFLGVVAQNARNYVWPDEERHLRRAFLETTLRFWEELEGEGARYGIPHADARTFSASATALVAALEREGLPMQPNPLTTPGRTYELLCAAVQKFKDTAPWPPS